MVSCIDWNANEPLSSIKVELWYGQKVLSCAEPLDHDSVKWSIEQLTFFLSDISLQQNGKQHALQLSNNDWQNANIALLRLSDACADINSQDTSDDITEGVELAFQSLQFAIPVALDDNSQLHFTLGLPFEINHLNPLSQPSPLNMPSMFWSWRGGHKFLRLDMVNDEDAWNFHLGSTGCSSASAMRSPQAKCVNPNTLQFTLARQLHGERLIVQLDKLLQGLTLNGRESCLMQSDKSSCQLLISNLAANGVFEWR